MFGNKKPPFTNDQYREIAKLVISEDADLIQSAITDKTKIDAMLAAFRRAINVVSGSQPRVVATTELTESVGEVVDPTATGALTGLISTVSPATAKKIQQAVAQ